MYYCYIVPPLLLKYDINKNTLNQSDALQITCVFSGQPVPYVKWTHEDYELQTITNKRAIVSNSNETTVVSTLTINDIQKSEEGNYTCKGVNNIPNHVKYIDQHSELITVQGNYFQFVNTNIIIIYSSTNNKSKLWFINSHFQ